MKFIDEAQIHVRAGDGGNGCVAFRREAHVAHGGPSGGDGGNGGSVIFRADHQLGSLLDFRYQRLHSAPRGEDGRSKDQYGKGGEDCILKVPIGTQIYDVTSGDLLGDLDEQDAELVVARGGIGGRGNIHFATPWNRAPRTAEPGTEGDKLEIRLELKLLAEVGLLGYPSVGKSTIISKISNARPKVADYPFTTLVPNLGVAKLAGESRTLVVADIPGLIEGAADGAGLGHQFLKHVERTKVLIHVLESNVFAGPDRDPIKDFDTINGELARFSPEMAKRTQVVVLNKIDLTETREDMSAIQEKFAARGIQVLPISAVTGKGLKPMLEAAWAVIYRTPEE